MIYDNDFTQISIVFFITHHFTLWAQKRNIYLFTGAVKWKRARVKPIWANTVMTPGLPGGWYPWVFRKDWKSNELRLYFDKLVALYAHAGTWKELRLNKHYFNAHMKQLEIEYTLDFPLTFATCRLNSLQNWRMSSYAF